MSDVNLKINKVFDPLYLFVCLLFVVIKSKDKNIDFDDYIGT